jgi:predicted transposase YbfD/YdcC
MNRINPERFQACFTSGVAQCWPDKLELVAIDGKTSRRSHNRKTGQKALHLVSAFATNSRLVLGQEAVAEKSNEITAIPALIERLDLDGALVSIDAMGCNPDIAQSILDAKADYLLAVKDNQPTLHADINSYFETAPATAVEQVATVGKDHGRIEVRTHTVSHMVDWYDAQRSYPGAPCFPQLATIAMIESRIEAEEPTRPSNARENTCNAGKSSRRAGPQRQTLRGTKAEGDGLHQQSAGHRPADRTSRAHAAAHRCPR